MKNLYHNPHRQRLLQVLTLMGVLYVLMWVLALGLMGVPLYASWMKHQTLNTPEWTAEVAGLLLLWAIMPRYRHFRPPGPRIHLSEHPRLRSLLQDIAQETGQPLPDEIYLMLENNAWVQESTFVVFRGKRRMGLGLPLMQVLSEQEFKAVLGHEYGHYQAGDTRLGGFLYGTRQAMIRTVKTLEGSVFNGPFLWYGTLFLQMTQTISRQQEMTADRLGATLTSPETMCSALRKVSTLGSTFEAYWETEVLPVLNTGHHPPILEGYLHYLQSEDARNLQDPEQEDAFDTHPSLETREDALRRMVRKEMPDEGHSALGLLEGSSELEQLVLRHFAGSDADHFQTLRWTEVGEKAWVPLWQAQLALYRSAFQDLCWLDLVEKLGSYQSRHQLLARLKPSFEVNEDLSWHHLRLQVVLALHGQGWQVQTLPGEQVVCQRESHQVQPFEDLLNIKEGKLTSGAWLKHLQEMGIKTDSPLLEGQQGRSFSNAD